MDFDFAAVLSQVVEQNASDLHLTVGSPPMLRVRRRGRRLWRRQAQPRCA
jgi:Tfp pilus assembly pilus retraction ATPase PilT